MTNVRRQKRRTSLTRLASHPSSHLFGTHALRSGRSTQIIPATSIPRQSSAMRFRRLSQSRYGPPNNDRALRSPERGMNRTMWRLDDREERRDHEFTPDEQQNEEYPFMLSNRCPSFQYDSNEAQENHGIHVPGWEYSHDQHIYTQPSSSQSVLTSPSVYFVRPPSALDPRQIISPPPTPQAWFRPASASSSKYSRPQSAIPLLPKPTPTNTTMSTSDKSTKELKFAESNHNRARSSPAAFFCLPNKFAPRHRPKMPTISISRPARNHKKNKRHSVETLITKPYELSPLRIRTPKKPGGDIKNTRDRSGMAEKPLSNITNSAQRRLSSIDVERGGEAKEGWDEAHGRFSYGGGPGPAVVDATMSSPLNCCNDSDKENGGPAPVPYRGKGKLVEVGSKNIKRKPLPRTPTTPWIDESTVTFEPFGVAFD